MRDNARPGMFRDCFYDQKGHFSLNCQVHIKEGCYELTHLGFKAIIMPHNLMIVDYALGQPGSVHDPYAFQGTQMSQDPVNVIPPHHWIWADSAYPCKTWCAVPFKKPHGGSLTCRQNTYNRYLSKVHTCRTLHDLMA